MKHRGLLTALAIVWVAATPGISESYLGWQQYPELRPAIVVAYAGLLLLALAIATHVIDGAGREG